MRIASTTERSARHTLRTFAAVIVIWTTTSLSYYWLLGALRVEDGLNDAPAFYAAFYLAWAAVAFLAFRRSHFDWLTAEAVIRYVPAASLLAAGLFGIGAVAIPSLPGLPLGPPDGPPHPFEMTSAYFLPKSAEILLQQLLIATLTIELKFRHLSDIKVATLVGLLFGGAHMMWAVIYPEPVILFRLTFAALLLGTLAPWLMLRLRCGFLVSYTTHWLIYAWLAPLFWSA
ncbi:hypothetical protein [Citreimonas salinaria]|uniref:CAAX protease self-immunity n=1 Tax=Citreimonas salinaria TaxID=321339 RepID=A0A1H3N9Y2_9RHOB|nr:hypothetical protein [Citreimonas salinaria]SDY85019.1 hypothetical protein SAMN05444340_12134 [Citreimonas salinaria]